MKSAIRLCVLITAFMLCVASLKAQEDPFTAGLGAIAKVTGETHTATDSVAEVPVKPIPVWKKKLYYGYNFDVYYHHDSRSNRKENGWSIALEPEIGWKLKERVYLGLRFGGSYANMVTTYDINLLDTTYSTDLRIHQGSWEVTPYVRYRMKTLFDGKLGIWMEAHLYTGMEFPRVSDGEIHGTDYDGLRYSITYGFQISPLITYRFNRKSTFQIFFSILSLGYSGTTFCYKDSETGHKYKEYTNDVIIFSGKLSNMLANQFTPGLYGLKFGVQKNF
ncbi:MAG: hypothetical protein IJS00_00195 [Paludibacteraceae bacterium]|nr:hypothetical protein [Paludibacteraceae bacterium]